MALTLGGCPSRRYETCPAPAGFSFDSDEIPNVSNEDRPKNRQLPSLPPIGKASHGALTAFALQGRKPGDDG